MRAKHFAAASAMSGILTPGAAAAGILALGLVAGAPAPAARAASGPVVVQPSVVRPGGFVSVFGMDCTAPTGTADSPVFAHPIKLAMLSNVTGGIAKISGHAAPGRWPVTLKCGDKTYTGWCKVTGPHPSPSPSTHPSSSAVPTPGPRPKPTAMPLVPPRGGAATGDGASQAAASTGLGSGALLAAIGVGAGTIMLRRRRSHGGD